MLSAFAEHFFGRPRLLWALDRDKVMTTRLSTNVRTNVSVKAKGNERADARLLLKKMRNGGGDCQTETRRSHQEKKRQCRRLKSPRAGRTRFPDQVKGDASSPRMKDSTAGRRHFSLLSILGHRRADVGPLSGPSAGPQEGDRAALPLAVERFLRGTALASLSAARPPPSTRPRRSPATTGGSGGGLAACRSPSTLTGHGRERCPHPSPYGDRPRSGSLPPPTGGG